MSAPQWVTGWRLSHADRLHVLRAYVHRFTKQHRPAWANKPRPDGSAYPVQFASDGEWLENTRFAVTKSGRLDRRVNRSQLEKAREKKIKKAEQRERARIARMDRKLSNSNHTQEN